MARQKVLPELSRLMGEPARSQTDEELYDAVQQWVATHNAKYEIAQQLGVS